jgi:hypothetical protein
VSIRLALRALWFRRGVSLALVAVATFVVAAAAAGPLYLRAAGESILQDRLRDAGLDAAGLEAVLLARRSEDPQARLDGEVAKALVGRSVNGRPISALEMDLAVRGAAGVAVTTRLASREGVCHQLVLTGRCPSAAGEVIVSRRTAERLGITTGDELAVDLLTPLTVVGLYTAKDETSPYWFHRTYFHPAGSTDPRTGAELVDSPFTVPATLEQLPADTVLRAVVDVPVDARALRLAEADAIEADSRAMTRVLSATEGAQVRTSLPDLLDAARKSADLLRVPILAVVLQLLVLSWLVLFTVVANSVDARGPEVALAKLRGLSSGATVGFGLLEPLLLLLVAVPLGLGLALTAVTALARRSLSHDVPVELSLLTFGAAGLAVLGGALAAGFAARYTLTRPALEQFRRTTPRGKRRGWAVDAAVLTLAVVGLVQLMVSGAVAGGEVDPLALLAPGLLSLAVALVVARLLPAACRGLAGPTRGRRRLGLFLAVRQVARRPGGARTVVVLVMAFGLATFSVSAWSVARDNRIARARTIVGAEQALTVSSRTGADTADAVRRADPAGHWAMAVSEVELLSSSTTNRKVLGVDSDRFARIAYWRGDFAPEEVRRLVAALRPQVAPPVMLRGLELSLRVRTERLRVVGADRSIAHLSALVEERTGRTRLVDLGPLPAATGELRGRIDCADGCRLAGLQLSKQALAEVAASFVVEQIADSTGVVDAGLTDASRWRALGATDPATLRGGGSGLSVGVSTSESATPVFAPADSPAPLPAVVTRSLLSGPSGEVQAVGLDKAPLPVSVVAVARALPRAQADGVLVDREYALRQAGSTGNQGTEQVWLGAAAPADAVARLEAAGLQVLTTDRAADTDRALARQGPALALLLFLVGAGAAALLAVGGTVLNLYLLGRRRVGELAALRLLGVGRRALLSGLLLEQGLLIGAGALGGVVAGVAGAVLALPSVPEFEGVVPAPPLLYLPRAAVLAALVAATMALLAVAVLLAVVGLLRGVGPERLREGPA